MPDPTEDAIQVAVSDQEKRQLAELADLAGLTLEQYARERLLAESSVEEQVLRFVRGELTAVARSKLVSGLTQPTPHPQSQPESPDEQKARILEEVRASLTDDQLEALATFFKPAFDAGLWSVRASDPRDS